MNKLVWRFQNRQRGFSSNCQTFSLNTRCRNWQLYKSDTDLANFIPIAAMKRVSRIDAEYLGKLDVDTAYCDPIFITPEERMKYGLRNKDSVKELIAENIREIVSTPVFYLLQERF